VSLALLLKILEGRSNTPNKLYLIVSWKAQNQQKKTIQPGNLVAPKRSSASTIFCGGDASSDPKHLSFLNGGTGNQSNGNLKTVIEGWRCRNSWQPSVKTVN
jgi:hypothetical protein